MEYRKYNDTYYIRVDKGDEIIQSILSVCEKENITSAVYEGIGGCSEAEIQIFNAAEGKFETTKISGMLELISLIGDVAPKDDGELYHHTHAMFSFVKDGKHMVEGGHMKSITVLYTAEIELRPVLGGSIGRKFDSETGSYFWKF